jgi:16S rRNA (adenine1518-N6/adenine1519-N6)-dimethyltransferase
MDSISDLFKEFSYRPRKVAGQNFLTDTKILDQIDQAIQCPSGDILLEVGGGYGVLTERLARKERLLTVVEVDHKLFAMLERKFGKTPGMALMKADILKVDLAPLAPPPPAKLTVAGNIPYYLTSPLITRLLTQYHPVVRRIYLMVQKEVADRLVARPGTKAYGALTLCAQFYSKPRKLVDVPARAFRPKPKVDSAFIELELKTEFPLEGESEKRFFTLVRAIFQTRRKMLSNSLKSLGKPPEKVQEALEKTSIDPQIRGEQLGLEKLVELTKALD